MKTPHLEEGQTNAALEADKPGIGGWIILIICSGLMVLPLVKGWFINRWHRFVFWLTVPKVCAWCKKKTRRALLPLGVPSHGICRACSQRELARLTHAYFVAPPPPTYRTKRAIEKLRNHFATHGSE